MGTWWNNLGSLELLRSLVEAREYLLAGTASDSDRFSLVRGRCGATSVELAHDHALLADFSRAALNDALGPMWLRLDTSLVVKVFQRAATVWSNHRHLVCILLQGRSHHEGSRAADGPRRQHDVTARRAHSRGNQGSLVELRISR